jgi:hypothetical protein
MEVPAELHDVPGDAVVGVMAYELGGQPLLLVRQRLVAVVATPPLSACWRGFI